MSDEDYRASVRAAVLAEGTFLRLTLSRPLRREGLSWVRVGVRPVLVKARRGLQFSYFDGEKDVTKNSFGRAAGAKLDEVLALPFGQVHVQSTSGDLHVRISRKGTVRVRRAEPSREEDAPDLSHDRTKRQPLPADPEDPLLRALGIVGAGGKVRAAMSGKFRQVNEFLRIVDRVVGEEERAEPLRVVDCGCGRAYLTFAAYRFLNGKRGVPVRVTGVDRDAELIGKCGRLRDELGWQDLRFIVSGIAEFEPERPPDVVLSLHACDTATDEALARGVQWESRAILAAPCCQHELHDRLRAGPLRPLLRQGILRQRQADLVTDAFRALALRVMGYRTSVIEFVSPDSTSRNLMIRAQRGVRPGAADAVQEYLDFRRFWDATPAIERLLGEPFGRMIGTAS